MTEILQRPAVRPEDFFSDMPPERIIGTETEYDIQFDPTFAYKKNKLAYFLHQENFEKIGILPERSTLNDDPKCPSSMFLSNGALAYDDVNGFFEYASAESLGPLEAAAADASGALILEKVMGVADAPHRGAFRRTGSTLKKKDFIIPRTLTQGHHENFLIPESMSKSGILHELLTSYLATRMWAWSGIVGETFELSQKISGIGVETSNIMPSYTSEAQKPMYHIHGEFDDSDILDEGWARLEVRFADATHLPHTKYLSLAGTSLVLRLAEHAHRLHGIEDVFLSKSLHAAQVANNDPNFRETLPDMRIGALDIQDMFVSLFEQLDAAITLPESERQAIVHLRQLIEDLKAIRAGEVPISKVGDRVEWVARQHFLTKKIGGGLLTIYNERAFMEDMQWDRVDGGYGQKYAARVNKRYKYTPSKDMIEFLVHNPPQRTRAKLRAQLITDPLYELHSMHWGHASGYSPDTGAKTTKWDNPYIFN